MDIVKVFQEIITDDENEKKTLLKFILICQVGTKYKVTAVGREAWS